MVERYPAAPEVETPAPMSSPSSLTTPAAPASSRVRRSRLARYVDDDDVAYAKMLERSVVALRFLCMSFLLGGLVFTSGYALLGSLGFGVIAALVGMSTARLRGEAAIAIVERTIESGDRLAEEDRRRVGEIALAVWTARRGLFRGHLSEGTVFAIVIGAAATPLLLLLDHGPHALAFFMSVKGPHWTFVAALVVLILDGLAHVAWRPFSTRRRTEFERAIANLSLPMDPVRTVNDAAINALRRRHDTESGRLSLHRWRKVAAPTVVVSAMCGVFTHFLLPMLADDSCDRMVLGAQHTLDTLVAMETAHANEHAVFATLETFRPTDLANIDLRTYQISTHLNDDGDTVRLEAKGVTTPVEGDTWTITLQRSGNVVSDVVVRHETSMCLGRSTDTR